MVVCARISLLMCPWPSMARHRSAQAAQLATGSQIRITRTARQLDRHPLSLQRLSHSHPLPLLAAQHQPSVANPYSQYGANPARLSLNIPTPRVAPAFCPLHCSRQGQTPVPCGGEDPNHGLPHYPAGSFIMGAEAMKRSSRLRANIALMSRQARLEAARSAVQTVPRRSGPRSSHWSAARCLRHAPAAASVMVCTTCGEREDDRRPSSASHRCACRRCTRCATRWASLACSTGLSSYRTTTVCATVRKMSKSSLAAYIMVRSPTPPPPTPSHVYVPLRANFSALDPRIS